MHVLVPRDAGESVFWLEQVTGGGIVYYDDVLKRPTQSRHIFHEESVVEGTMFSVEKSGGHCLLVELRIQRLRVLRETGSEHDDLVVVTHSGYKLLAVRSLQNVYMLDLAVNLYWLHDIRIVDWLERGVHKRLV